MANLQGSCTLAGAETTRFVFPALKLYRLNLYVQLQHVLQHGPLRCKDKMIKYDETAAACAWVDQVVTDMRLWLRHAISTLTDNAVQLISAMVDRAAV